MIPEGLLLNGSFKIIQTHFESREYLKLSKITKIMLHMYVHIK